MYSPDDFNYEEENKQDTFNYKHSMKEFYKKRYSTEVTDSFDGGYYVNILENDKLITTRTIYCRTTQEAELNALESYVKEKHGY